MIKKARMNFVDGSNHYTIELERILVYDISDDTYFNAPQIPDLNFNNNECTYDHLTYFLRENRSIVILKNDKKKEELDISGHSLSKLIELELIERVINSASIKSFEPIIEKTEEDGDEPVRYDSER